VEPFANDRTEDNLNPNRPRFLFRLDATLYARFTDQEVGLALRRTGRRSSDAAS